MPQAYLAVILALLAGLAAMLCYGVASVLQALGARRTTSSEGLDARLLIRLAREVPYVSGLVLDLVGFGFQVVAVQTLPLFLVQSLIAASVGVTALVATRLLRVRLTPREWWSLAALVVGLALLAVAAEPGAADVLTPAARWSLLLAVPAVGVLGAWGARTSGRAGFLGLSVGAGAAFAGVGVAARGLDLARPPVGLLTDPALWAVVGFGLLGTLLFATALQRGSVTVASAILFGAETVLASAVGVLLYGDSTRPGLGPLAVAGLVITLAGAVALAPYAEPVPPAA